MYENRVKNFLGFDDKNLVRMVCVLTFMWTNNFRFSWCEICSVAKWVLRQTTVTESFWKWKETKPLLWTYWIYLRLCRRGKFNFPSLYIVYKMDFVFFLFNIQTLEKWSNMILKEVFAVCYSTKVIIQIYIFIKEW